MHGDIEEATWTKSYRGGWQMLAPNAGNACEFGGVDHGFHGRASVDCWKTESSSDKHGQFSWLGHGLKIQRLFLVHDHTLNIHVKIEAIKPSAAFIATEHITFGLALLEPSVQIVTPGGSVREMSERSPFGPQAVAWPSARLLDGTLERCDSWSSEQPRSRLLCLGEIPQGWIAVGNGNHSLGAAIEWTPTAFPYCWIWHENKGAAGVWEKRAQILGLEPSMVPHHCGLGRAVENGQAHLVAQGESFEYYISLRVLTSEASFDGFVKSQRAKFT